MENLADSPLPRRCHTLIIGAGVGGAVTAATLAQNGCETVMVEEGDFYQQQHTPFSWQEIRDAYRRGGMTVALGNAPINYAEASCVGGGSEINSGLYHRPPPALLSRWAKAGAYGIDSQEMLAYCQANEDDLAIKPMPQPVQPASQILANGADALGWHHTEVPRWHDYDEAYSPLAPGGVRRSMSQTFLPRFLRHGGRLVSRCRVHHLQPQQQGWAVTAYQHGNPCTIHAQRVVVAGGAVQTPLLLRRSGIKHRIGNTLRLHVFVRVLAEFKHIINSEQAGIGPHQIDTFAPPIRMGCGVSTPAHLAAAIAQCNNAEWRHDHHEKWQHRAAYYVSVGGGIGAVRHLAGGEELVTYQLTKNCYYHLADGIRHLTQLLFRAGAVRCLAVIDGMPSLSHENQLWQLPRPLTPARACLTSVHLMGTCPMGSAVLYNGAVAQVKNLYVADASLFCDSPNVNPQGTLMAVVRRNAHLLVNQT